MRHLRDGARAESRPEVSLGEAAYGGSLLKVVMHIRQYHQSRSYSIGRYSSKCDLRLMWSRESLSGVMEYGESWM